MKYRHLTESERYQIQVLNAQGLGPTVIGKLLGRCKSVISRELRRNQHAGRYRARNAQRSYRLRLKAKGKSRQPWTPIFHETAVPLLQEGWSPEQISGVFRGTAYAVSHEWIYQRILRDRKQGGVIYKLLRCQKARRKRYGKPDRRGQILNRRPISDRPPEVEARSRTGDWEADTVIGAGHQGAIVTLVERKTGFSKLILVPSKESEGVTRAIIAALKPHKEHVHSITFDNGKEFAGHQEIARQLDTECFFADSYSSWQRGSNENLNGLLRQYFPKGTDFRKINQGDVATAERKLNERPRKRLGWHCPRTVFEASKSLNQLTS